MYCGIDVIMLSVLDSFLPLTAIAIITVIVYLLSAPAPSIRLYNMLQWQCSSQISQNIVVVVLAFSIRSLHKYYFHQVVVVVLVLVKILGS